MAPQKKYAKANTSIPLQYIPNHMTRSHFGDNRAATEDQMMLEHAKLVRENGLIDDETAAQISRAWHRGGELQMQWKKEYLQMHPEYAVGEKGGMITFDTAMKKRRKNDREMVRLVEDWRAGRVDEDGVEIFRDGEDALGDDDDGDDDDDNDDDDEFGSFQEEPTSPVSEETNSPDENTEKNPPFATATFLHQQTAKDDKSPSSKKTPPSNHIFTSTSTSTSTSTTLQTLYPTTVLFTQTYILTPPQTTSHPPNSLPTRPRALNPTPRSRVRKPKAPTPPPLQPLPNYPTYASLVYGQVAALCRERNLPGGGVTQELRNRLIRDDINVARGLPREKRGYRGNKRTYKFSAPVAGGGEGSRGGGEGGDGEEEGDREIVWSGAGGLKRKSLLSEEGGEGGRDVRKLKMCV